MPRHAHARRYRRLCYPLKYQSGLAIRRPCKMEREVERHTLSGQSLERLNNKLKLGEGQRSFAQPSNGKRTLVLECQDMDYTTGIGFTEASVKGKTKKL
jgi:hypothetical protein